MSDADEVRTAARIPEAGEREAFTQLWARLQAYDLDKAGDNTPFTTKLAAECGWSRGKARRVAFEYKRFVAIALSSGHGACPSRAVDEAWHLHLLDTRRYWGEFCRGVLQRDFHHEPGRGGIEEDLRFADLYRHTLDDYRRLFGEEPPAEIWPAPDQPSPTMPATGRGLLRRLRGWLRRGIRPAAFAALLLGVSGCAALYDSSSPGAIQGPSFLALYIVLLVAAVMLSRALQDRVNGPAPREGSSAALGPYHLAYLAGGANRVCEAAITRLYADGIIAIQSGKAVLLRPVPPQAPALDRLIGEELADGRLQLRPISIEIAVEPFRQDLLKAGLVPGSGELERTRQIPFLLLGPLLLFALIRFFHGLANGRPVTLLALCLGATIFLMIVTAMRTPPRTRAGTQALRQAESAVQARGKPPSNSPAVIDWVALHGQVGLAGLGLTAFSYYLATEPALAARSGAGSSCGGGGGDGGGGCGGGGCGGGGCGG